MRNLRFLFVLMIVILTFGAFLSSAAEEKKDGEEFYTIKPGDTLWDISSRFLKNPFLWPKLWQRNPYIANPHWIYPGHPIRLSPLETEKKEELRREVAEERPAREVKEAEVKKAEAPPVEKKPEFVAEVKPAEERPSFFPGVRSAGFVGPMDYRGIGMILENRDGKILLAEGDIVYIALKTGEPVGVGDKYTLFRPSDIVRHPMTGQKIGRKYEVTGNVQVIEQNGRYYTAKIIEAFREVYNGDRIHPYSKEKMEAGGKK